MAKNFNITFNKKTVGLVVLAILVIISLRLYVSEQNVSKDKPEETYHNFGFNFKGECAGKTNMSRLSPLQYTFSSLPFFRKYPYFNYYNSPQIIGCGGRRAPCDTRHAIPNVLDPIDISNRNIAPHTVHVDGNLDMKLQKVGAIYKIFGNDNEVFPLMGRKLYYNDEKWEYFASMGPTGEYLRVFQQRQWEELGNNDEVEIEGRCGKYRVAIYDRFMPQYTPFI